VPARARGTAVGQPAQHLGLLGRQRVPLPVGRAVPAQDVPDYPSRLWQGWTHDSLPLRSGWNQGVR
jgi:hypothetical protein